MKDFLGNELNVGDEVVSIELGYKSLYRTKIVKITAKTIFVLSPWHSYSSYVPPPIKRTSNQVVKVTHDGN